MYTLSVRVHTCVWYISQILAREAICKNCLSNRNTEQKGGGSPASFAVSHCINNCSYILLCSASFRRHLSCRDIMSDRSRILQAIKETDGCFDPIKPLWLICKKLYCGFFLKFGRITTLTLISNKKSLLSCNFPSVHCLEILHWYNNIDASLLVQTCSYACVHNL